MLVFKQILAATPARIKDRARHQCYGQAFAVPRGKRLRDAGIRSKRVTRSGGYLVEDESGKYREFKFRVKCTDGWRKVVVRFYGPLNINTRVWCWCSCPYFKYHCEVALAHRGSSAVVQSNGQRPRFTNPKLEPRVCKHAFLGFAIAMRRRRPDVDDENLNQPKGRAKRRQTDREVWSESQKRGPMSEKQTTLPENVPAPIDFGVDEFKKGRELAEQAAVARGKKPAAIDFGGR